VRRQNKVTGGNNKNKSNERKILVEGKDKK
jgi:hypothetical protein